MSPDFVTRTGDPTPAQLVFQAARANTSSLAFSLFCCFGREIPTLRLSHCRAVHFRTLCPIETRSDPLESTFSIYTATNSVSTIPSDSQSRSNVLSGGSGGNRTRVLNTFLSTSYSYNSVLQFLKNSFSL